MKLVSIVLLLGFLSASDGNSAQSGGSSDFLVDKTKHYVYLKFDHVGDRKPVIKGETTRGLWLRLVNNCKIPIVIATFNSKNGDPGIGVFDEIVQVSKKRVVRFEKGTKSQSARKRPTSPPTGYALPEAFSTNVVASGDDVLFSVPLNHISSDWGLQIRFYLDVPGDPYAVGPYSIVGFGMADIPENVRQTLTANGNTTLPPKS